VFSTKKFGSEGILGPSMTSSNLLNGMCYEGGDPSLERK